MPVIERADPRLAAPGGDEIMMTGLLYCSTKRLATMPIIPAGQAGCDNTIAFVSSRLGSCSIWAIAPWKTWAVSNLRRAFNPSSSRAIKRALPESGVISNSTIGFASANLPRAFRRGARAKLICSSVTRLCEKSRRSKIASNPGRCEVRKVSSPRCSKYRVSPVRNARSATIPNATRSSCLAASSLFPNRSHSSWANL